MSNPENRVDEKETAEALEAKYTAARAQIERSRQIEMGQSGALFFAAMAFGDALEKSSLMKRASHLAQLFCIAAAFIIPILLFVRVAM